MDETKIKDFTVPQLIKSSLPYQLTQSPRTSYVA